MKKSYCKGNGEDFDGSNQVKGNRGVLCDKIRKKPNYDTN